MCLVSTALAACVTPSSASWTSIRCCVPAADFSLAAMEGIIGDLTRMTAERDRSESAALHVSYVAYRACKRCSAHAHGSIVALPSAGRGHLVVSKLFSELCAEDPLMLAIDFASMRPAGMASVESLQQVLKNQNEQLARSNLQTGDQVGQWCWVVMSGA